MGKNTNNNKNAAGKKPLSLKKLLLLCFILIVAPYAYLMLCGLIFDMWLKMYGAVLFIFYSLITFYVVDIILIILLVIKYVRQRKGGGGR